MICVAVGLCVLLWYVLRDLCRGWVVRVVVVCFVLCRVDQGWWCVFREKKKLCVDSTRSPCVCIQNCSMCAVITRVSRDTSVLTASHESRKVGSLCLYLSLCVSVSLSLSLSLFLKSRPFSLHNNNDNDKESLVDSALCTEKKH